VGDVTRLHAVELHSCEPDPLEWRAQDGLPRRERPFEITERPRVGLGEPPDARASEAPQVGATAERRPEVRYWLNRILRAVYRCERCGGLGYCPTFEPVASEAPAYSGVPCRRCGRSEWQHGEQWIGDGVYGRPACDDCRGLGTYWNHYAVD